LIKNEFLINQRTYNKKRNQEVEAHAVRHENEDNDGGYNSNNNNNNASSSSLLQ